MRWLIIPLLLVSLLFAGLSASAAEVGKIHKVLPQYLDLEGRASLSPSLYERDAYQAKLLLNPEMRSGLVFHVHHKARKELKLIIEARGVLRGKTASLVVVEQPVAKSGFFEHWSKITITGEDFKQLQTLTAWRASLWDGDQLVSEYKSFLW